MSICVTHTPDLFMRHFNTLVRVVKGTFTYFDEIQEMRGVAKVAFFRFNTIPKVGRVFWVTYLQKLGALMILFCSVPYKGASLAQEFSLVQAVCTWDYA
eukprot:2693347-Amphidinium_carterae.1